MLFLADPVYVTKDGVKYFHEVCVLCERKDCEARQWQTCTVDRLVPNLEMLGWRRVGELLVCGVLCQAILAGEYIDYGVPPGMGGGFR